MCWSDTQCSLNGDIAVRGFNSRYLCGVRQDRYSWLNSSVEFPVKSALHVKLFIFPYSSVLS
jgi:hypothetical protein